MAASMLSAEDRLVLASGDAQAINRRLNDSSSEMPDEALSPPKNEDLVVVGTGIRMIGQVTLEALAWMRQADRLLYMVAEPVAEEAIRQLNPGRAESLADLYAEGKPRRQTYEEMIERILESIRAGSRTCAVFYGHPGVFVHPSHEAIKRARKEGFRARMLPGISAEDCLFADLGFDPATAGCQSFEASDFLLNRRRIDPSSHVVLWQIGVLGEWSFQEGAYPLMALPLLIERLRETYDPSHVVSVYEASVFPGCEPAIRQVPLERLAEEQLTAVSTLYVPPGEPPRTDFALFQTLGMASHLGGLE